MADYFSQFEDAPTTPQIPSSGDFFSQFEGSTGDIPGIKGVGKDIQDTAFRTAMSIPGVLAAAPSEIYGAGKQALSLPYEAGKMAIGKGGLPRAMQNVVGGLGELGHAILSAPGALRDYLVRKEFVSPSAPSFRLPESVLPRDFNYAEALGRKGKEKGDVLMEMLPAFLGAPEAAGGVAQAIPLTKRIASAPLREAREITKSRDIGKLAIPKEVMNKAEKALPNKKEYKELLKHAKKGSYEALFDLQSDLGTHAREFGKFPSTAAERLKSRNMDTARQDLINAIKTSLEDLGHGDVADLMGKGQQRYRRYMTQKPYRHTAIWLAISQSPEARKLLRYLLLRD